MGGIMIYTCNACHDIEPCEYNEGSGNLGLPKRCPNEFTSDWKEKDTLQERIKEIVNNSQVEQNRNMIHILEGRIRSLELRDV